MAAKDNDGRTPAHLAAQNGHDGALRALKEMGADMAAKSNDGDTPAHSR